MIATTWMAMSAVQGAAGEPTPAGQTWFEYLSAGGEMMVPIGICSVLAVAFSIERFFALSRPRICPDEVDGVLDAIAGGDAEASQQALTELKDSPAKRILSAGMRRRGFELRDVEVAMEDQGLKEVEKLRRNIRPLNVVAGVAPLMGLLGTVLGISEAFSRVVDAGMGKPEVLAAGIEEALVTTIAGLSVAIPCILVASWLAGKMRKLMLQVDERLAPAIEHLARPRVVEASDAA